MKKRNILTIALALVLTVVLSVGATLAYLTDNDEEVINTFTFANGMTVTLTEPEPAKANLGDATATKNDNKGYDYTNVVPGQTLEKKPTIKTTTSVDAYVFVKISGANGLVQPVGITNGWEKVDLTAEYPFSNGVYYKEVSGEPGEQDLKAIFEEVKVGPQDLTSNSTEVDLGSIKIEVFEIQKNGITAAEGKTVIQTALDQATWQGPTA